MDRFLVRLEHELRHHHLPILALDVIEECRRGDTAVPADDGQYLCGAAAHPGRRLETPGETPHRRARRVQQFPTPPFRDARLQRIAGTQRGDGTVDRIVFSSPPREAKIHVLKTGPDSRQASTKRLAQSMIATR